MGVNDWNREGARAALLNSVGLGLQGVKSNSNIFTPKWIKSFLQLFFLSLFLTQFLVSNTTPGSLKCIKSV